MRPNAVIIHGKRISDASPRARYPAAELWPVGGVGVNDWGGKLDDWTAWFDLHPVEPMPYHPGIKQKRPLTYLWYRQQPAGHRPIFLLDHDPDIPASVAFPRADVQAVYARYGDGADRMFTCQVDWMMAYALLLGYAHIVLDGIGVKNTPTHRRSHEGIWYWIGFARASGVRVEVVAPSYHCSPALVYGYETAPVEALPPGVAVDSNGRLYVDRMALRRQRLVEKALKT